MRIKITYNDESYDIFKPKDDKINTYNYGIEFVDSENDHLMIVSWSNIHKVEYLGLIERS